MKNCLYWLLLVAVSGCASIKSLPQSANEVDFGDTIEGKTGWSEYQGLITVPTINAETAYEAAKEGLRSAGFTISRANLEGLAVMGQHGMTAYDWNIVAGVYIKIEESQTLFKTIVEGSKDIGFSGDATGSDWVGRISGGIRSYLANTPAASASPMRPGTSAGTCFVVTPDGKILSNNHVVSGGKRFLVTLSDGREMIARMQTQSRSTDLAMLEVDASDLNYLPMTGPRTAKTGMEVFTVGYPVTSVLGEEAKFTDGVISSLSGVGGEAAFLQITVPLQPGSSGGPLVNYAGEVVGITTSTAAIGAFIEAAGTLPQNVNWAVKSDYALLLFDQPQRPHQAANRQEAIDRALSAVCRIVAER